MMYARSVSIPKIKPDFIENNTLSECEGPDNAWVAEIGSAEDHGNKNATCTRWQGIRGSRLIISPYPASYR